jgi:D-amino-acid oxidase
VPTSTLFSRPLNAPPDADVWTPHTTSDGAGAFWERRSDAHTRWARATMQLYAKLIESGEGEEAGVGYVDGVCWDHEKDQYSAFAEDVPSFGWASEEELAAVRERMGEPYASGAAWRSVIVDSPTYLRWLMSKITAMGGVFVKRRVDSLAELGHHFHVVINSTGMGARELAGDKDVHAYRGQVRTTEEGEE